MSCSNAENQLDAVYMNASQSELTQWYETPAEFPHFYFRSRDRSFELRASGMQHEIKKARFTSDDLDEVADYLRVAKAKGETIIGGLAFDPAGPSSTEWRDFPALWFWKPARLEVFEKALKPNFIRRPCSDGIIDRSNIPEKQEFAGILSEAQTRIINGDFAKIVLARKVELSLAGSLNALACLEQLEHALTPSFKFYLSPRPEQALWGVSPERLFLLEDGVITTEALAGTVAGNDSELSGKNATEQQIVVDYIASCLKVLASDIEFSSAPQEVTFHHIKHFKTEIKARLNPSLEALDVLLNLHPSAAVCGKPRQQSYAFLREFEPFSRGWYAGTLGVISPQRTEFLVAIRSVLSQGQSAALFSGVGIVEQSRLEDEWQELESKISPLLELIDVQL